MTIADSVGVFTSFAFYGCSSANQRFGFESYDHGRVIPRQYRWKPEWMMSGPIESIENVEDPKTLWSHWTSKYMGFDVRSRWVWKYLGFYVWRQHDPDPTECFIEYRTIVIPLTLISLWLLLSKPRQSTPKKIAEPAANEGGVAT
jgi:hypothetical protein